jgi:hypothetical protein
MLSGDQATYFGLAFAMSTELLIALVVGPTAAVVVAMFLVMWSARTSSATSRAAIIAGVALAIWGVIVGVLAARGSFLQPDGKSVPPVGITLLAVFILLGIALAASASLRSLLANQQHLVRLNVWRLEGIVFLLLMLSGQMPPLWALPAGIGDILVGATAFGVASRLDEPNGRRRAIAFNVFGLADLVVAVGLGMMTNPGPVQLFQTTPTSELVTHFPLALVPTFLVPLAFALHVASLWQLLKGTWARR